MQNIGHASEVLLPMVAEAVARGRDRAIMTHSFVRLNPWLTGAAPGESVRFRAAEPEVAFLVFLQRFAPLLEEIEQFTERRSGQQTLAFDGSALEVAELEN